MFKIQKLPVKIYVLYTAIIALGVLLDRVSKILAVKYLRPVGDFPLIRGVFHLTYVENEGAAFGQFAEHRWVFLIFSAIVIPLLGLYLYFGGFSYSKAAGIAGALIVSGGIGNMIERLGQGYVVDFLNFELIDFAVFNIADSLICIGAGLLALAVILDMIREEREKKRNADR